MKFNIQAGSHPAQVEITPDGMGGFTGSITHTQFGDGQITEGTQVGNALKGVVTLDGHTATFTAMLDGQSISGKVSMGWLLSQSFTGFEAA